MKQLSHVYEPVMLHIEYEADQKKNIICENRDHLYNIMQLMFGQYMGEAVYKILDKRGFCKFPSGEWDRLSDNYLHVYDISADFNYQPPKADAPIHKKAAEPEPVEEKKENADEIQQERTETEDF